jgi:hypothetical protein
MITNGVKRTWNLYISLHNDQPEKQWLPMNFTGFDNMTDNMANIEKNMNFQNYLFADF